MSFAPLNTLRSFVASTSPQTPLNLGITGQTNANIGARLFGPGYTPPTPADAYVGNALANVAVDNIFSQALKTGAPGPIVRAAQAVAAPGYTSNVPIGGPVGMAPSTKLAIGVALGAVGLVGLVALMRRGN